jgi:hypothetical protein
MEHGAAKSSTSIRAINVTPRAVTVKEIRSGVGKP